MTPEELAAIRERETPHDGPPEFVGTYCAHGVPLDGEPIDEPFVQGVHAGSICEVRTLLAHIDAITEGVRRLEDAETFWYVAEPGADPIPLLRRE